MPRHLIVSTRGEQTTEEHVADWEDVKFRVPFIRDVCSWEVEVYRLSPNGERRKVKPPPYPHKPDNS